jgi:hypothetical protein
MPWHFVGRAAQIERICRALRERSPGPIVIVGEPGVGRTTVLSRALEHIEDDLDEVLRVEPAGDAPLAALRPHLGDDVADSGLPGEAVKAAARALSERAADRRLVVVLDDAHLFDHPSVLALRALCRQGNAVLLATCVTARELDGHSDPTDSLRYEPGIQTISLPPLNMDEVAAVLAGVVSGPVHPATAEALHVVTGGRPRLLHELVIRHRLGESMVRRSGMWRMGEAPYPLVRGVRGLEGTADVTDDADNARRLVEAARLAWRELAVDRADELCRMAMWHGAGERVAPVWANVLLLRGRIEECLRFFDSLPDSVVETSPDLALVKAMTLAFGLGRPQAVDEFLLRATSHSIDLRDRLLAYRAWILAISGQADSALAAVDGVDRSDRETAIFVHATRAAITLGSGHADEAVFHLRRALATAETCPSAPPWMAPFLTANLIDAMLIAGRIGEATTIANGFHGGEPGSGWDVAVTLSALLSGRRPRQGTQGATPEARIA